MMEHLLGTYPARISYMQDLNKIIGHKMFHFLTESCKILSHFLTDTALFLYDQVVTYMVMQDHVKYLIPSYKIVSNILYGQLIMSCIR